MKKIMSLIILFLTAPSFADQEFSFRTLPYLQNPTSTGMTIMWQTQEPAYGWIEYGKTRELGSKADAVVDGLKRANVTTHKIQLSSLEPGTTYFYRVCFVPITDFQPYHVTFSDTVCSNIFSYSTLADNAHTISCVIFNDIHNHYALFDKLCKAIEDVDYQFSIFNGDCFSDPKSDKDVLDALSVYNKGVSGSERPVLYIRGNHETRGAFARHLKAMFDFPDDEFYFAKTMGPVRFIFLDCGEDKSDDHKEYSGLNDFSGYRQRQKEWLHKEIKSEAFQKARYHILVHHIPLYNDGNRGVSSFSRELWEPVLKDAPIDLAISGHTHHFNFVPVNAADNPYPVLIGGGRLDKDATVIELSATDEQLTLEVRDINGKVLGTFEKRDDLALTHMATELPTEDPPQGPLHPMLAKTIQAGPYAPQWASLVTHPMPEWFQNDRIGLSAHWGPYAVPGWTPRKDTPYGVAYAEWYWTWLKQNEAVKKYHQDTYRGVPYDDFVNGTLNVTTDEIDGFFAQDFDADRWMQTFKDAGVKYFFITAKHHDGFCLWDSKYTDRNSVKMGPKRDILRELVDAARRHDIRIGFYYSFYEWFNPIYRGESDLSTYKGITPLDDVDADGELEYVDDFMIPQLKELIDNFHPDYLCFDGEWDHGYTFWRARQIVAYYYNQAAARGQEVVINDRYGQKKEGVSDTRGVYGDFYHVEYFANIDRAKPWAMWRGFGNSYGYNRNEHPSNILSLKQTLQMMVDVVADNGNVEFNLGPKADGTLAEFEKERLAAMGAWLNINGESIYGAEKSPVGVLPHGRVTHKPKEKKLYFHVYDWPQNGVIELPGIYNNIVSARLFDGGQELIVSKPSDNVVRIVVPDSPPDPYISTIVLTYEGELRAERFELPEK